MPSSPVRVTPDAFAAYQFLFRVLQPEQVVVRRADTIVFLDETTLAHSARLDLHVASRRPGKNIVVQAPTSPTTAGPSAKVPVPLTSVARTARTTFEVRDRHGSLLPILVKSDERELVWQGLEVMLKARFGSPQPKTLAAIRELVVDETPTAEEVADCISKLPAADRVRVDDRLRSAIVTCAMLYHVTVLMDEDVPRTVATMAWASTIKLAPPRSTKPRFPFWSALSSMGTQLLKVDASTAGQVGSYHAEVHAPHDLYFRAASLDWTMQQVVPAKDEASQGEPDDGAVSTRAHMHLAAPRNVRRAQLSLLFAHRATGLPRTSVLSSALTWALLAGWFVLVWNAKDHTPQVDGQSAVALCLLVPTAIGALLVAPSPHSLTARVIYPTRIVLGLVSLCPLAPAFTLALKWGGDASLWIVGLSLSYAFAGFLVLLYQLGRLQWMQRSADARLS